VVFKSDFIFILRRLFSMMIMTNDILIIDMLVICTDNLYR